ncbi:MAG TPA: hypothetical protein VHD61_11775 [Lacunisphaera sp.]|nr:hypothetical protein [Lacunisphaera sp.]
MKIAFGLGEGPAYSPIDFSPDELAAARKAGAKLEISFSNTMQESYMANVCPTCGILTGDFYLHDFWDLANEQTKVAESKVCLACVDAARG